MAGPVRETRLTAAEIGTLWTQYMNDSMATHVLKYLFAKAEDDDIKSILGFYLNTSQAHLGAITNIFVQDQVPVPVAFTEGDVNIKAPRLFSDMFALRYLHQWSIIGLSAFGVGLGLAARADIRAFYSECISSTVILLNKAADILLAKGIYVRAPYIQPPEATSFAKNQGFLGHLFGEQKRPLSAIEIGQLYANIHTNTLGKAMMLGFSQTAHSKDVRQFTMRLKEISKKHVEIFSSYLAKEDLNPPVTWDTEVMNSTEPPFSDKLILFHSGFLIAAGIANYGASLASSARKDLALTYSRLLPEIALIAEDSSNILIGNHWFEEPPLAPDRNALAENRPH